MPGADRPEFETLQEQDPWQDADWLPSDTNILFPEDVLSELMLEQPVTTIAVSHPATIGPGESLQTALFRMRQRHARALLVVEDDKLIGILTDRDAVVAIQHPGDDGGDLVIHDVMTPDPITIEPDDPLGKAAQLLSVDGVHHLPIVEDGAIRGLVAQGPILHAIIAALIEADES